MNTTKSVRAAHGSQNHHPPESTPLRDSFVTVDAAAAALGVSRWTIQRLLSQGELKSMLVSTARRVSISSINDFIERNLTA